VSAKRVLFVDNRPEFAHQPVLRLQLEGYAVEEAIGAEAGFAKLRDGVYDLLILDAQLPGTDGWRVLQEMRADPSLSDTKVIVLMAGKGETGNLALVEVDGELRRPFTMAELVETVKQVLGS
jgi:DNA-binding response OmpR family regulator